MSELTSYYDAFSFKPITEEALDHISVEAGFVGYLRIKEAFAQTNENAEQAAIAAEASTGFVNDHLSYIAQPLAASLAESGVSYLASAGAALLSRVGPCRTLPVLPDLTGEALCTDSTFDCGVSLS